MRLALVVLLPLLTLVSARAQTVVYEGVTTQLNIQAIAGHTYAWEIYDDATVDFAVVQGKCPVTSASFTAGNTGSSVQVKWIKPGIYFYKVTARDAALCAMNLKVGMIKVQPIETKAVITGLTVTGSCKGVSLSASNSVGVNYEWSLIEQGGALSATTGVNTEFKLPDNYDGPLPASFQVKLLVSDLTGHSDHTIVTIKVDRPPHAEVYIPGKYEKDGTILANGSTSSGTNPKYNWYSSDGSIIGAKDQQFAKLLGAGIYTLKIDDIYNCHDEYSFPLKFNQIIARRDYARTSWVQDTTINVLENDNLPESFITGPVHITEQPKLGVAQPNTDGTVTYAPGEKRPGRDQFVYEVCDSENNCSSAIVTIDIYDSPIFTPEGFSPNGDNLNDLLIFNGLEAYPNSQLIVFTRAGSIVYKNDDYKNDWDGTNQESSTSNPKLVTTGTYYYVLKLGSTGRTLKQFIYIAY